MVVLPILNTLHIITDSPSSQYRNRSILCVVAHFPALFYITASWTWLEAGHGKEPCDGAGGAIKKKPDHLVKARQFISNAQVFCQAISATDTSTIILEVQLKTIADCKNEVEAWNLQNVPGTAKAMLRYRAYAFIFAAHPVSRIAAILKGQFFIQHALGERKQK